VVWKTADGFVVWKQLNVGQAASWELLKAIIFSALSHSSGIFRYRHYQSQHPPRCAGIQPMPQHASPLWLKLNNYKLTKFYEILHLVLSKIQSDMHYHVKRFTVAYYYVE